MDWLIVIAILLTCLVIQMVSVSYILDKWLPRIAVDKAAAQLKRIADAMEKERGK